MNKTIKSLMLGSLAATLLAGLAGPALSVQAGQVDYHSDPISAPNTSGATLNILPMGDGATNNKVLGGAYTIKQVKAMNELGEYVDVEGEEYYAGIDGLDPVTGEFGDYPTQISFTGEGVYEYRNTERVPGYFLDTQVYMAEIPGTGHFDFSGTIAEGYAQKNGLELVEFVPGMDGNDGTSIFTFPKLNLVRGDIRFTKTDAEGNPLAGAQFKLEQITDVRLSKTEELIVREVITDDSGLVEFMDLPEGTYRVTELTAPLNFVQASEPQIFSVTVDEAGLNQVTKEITDEYEDVINDSNHFINYKELGYNVRLSSRYEDRGIYASNETLGAFYQLTLPEDIHTYTSLNINATLPEEFYLQIPEGAFSIRTETGETVKYQHLQDGQDMNIQFMQQDLELLEGAKEIYINYPIALHRDKLQAEMTSQFEYDVEWDNGRGVTGSETKYANIIYKEGIIEMVVADGDVGTAVEGAEFQLYELDLFLTASQDPDTYEGDSIYVDGQFYTPADNPITGEAYTGVTDSAGGLIFRNLPFGEYKIVQTVTPEGYRQNKTVMDVEVDDTDYNREDELGNIEHDIVVVNVNNYKGAGYFPGTGTHGNILAISVATAMVIGVAGISYMKKREQDAEQQ